MKCILYAENQDLYIKTNVDRIEKQTPAPQGFYCRSQTLKDSIRIILYNVIS